MADERRGEKGSLLQKSRLEPQQDASSKTARGKCRREEEQSCREQPNDATRVERFSDSGMLAIEGQNDLSRRKSGLLSRARLWRRSVGSAIGGWGIATGKRTV